MELSGAKRMRISSSTKELPEELIRTEILARLPIKSLARFKSVCKSWLSVFSSDPQFIKELCRRNPDDYDRIIAKTSSFHIVILSRYRQKFCLGGDESYELIGSANGLVCVKGRNRVALWNPAIYQSKEIDILRLHHFLMSKIGFGFDPVSNDYKVVVCLHLPYSLGLDYVVYSSNSGTWSDRQHIPGFGILMSKFKKSLTPTTMVKYCPYWTCSTRVQNKTSLTPLKFDATSNKFMLLAEFCCDVTSEHDKTFKFVNMKDHLALVVCEPSPVSKIEVHSLDEENGCGGVWSKMYNIGPFDQSWSFEHAYQGFKYGGEILFSENRINYCYDHVTKTFKYIPGPSPLTVCFTYTPSLISLQGMTSIFSKNQTTTHGYQYGTRVRLIHPSRILLD